jgi:hypothetical protein
LLVVICRICRNPTRSARYILKRKHKHLCSLLDPVSQLTINPTRTPLPLPLPLSSPRIGYSHPNCQTVRTR